MRGTHEGTVLVFDDVTPLVRTQRVAAWRDVARRLAHEIKNPLTPIQLSAERMGRHFGGAPGSDPRAGRRVHLDDRRRGRVAESAGRRVRAVRADAGAARRAVEPERRC
jgi:signal transduction histidine kinase